jgi:hypothetical protein
MYISRVFIVFGEMRIHTLVHKRKKYVRTKIYIPTGRPRGRPRKILSPLELQPQQTPLQLLSQQPQLVSQSQQLQLQSQQQQLQLRNRSLQRKIQYQPKVVLQSKQIEADIDMKPLISPQDFIDYADILAIIDPENKLQ